jgi:hypothetical protein
MDKRLLAGAGIALASMGAHAQLTGPVRLNDTGALLCVQADGTTTPHCAGTGQDGAYGRDATAPADGNGHGGFKFVKLDAKGHPLPADATTWRCIADRVTGLVWEVKTDNGGVDGAGWSYTNLGIAGRRHDTAHLVAEVNGKALCGSSKWRLPTFNELHGIVDYGVGGQPQIDLRFFPNVRQFAYWSSTGYADDPDAAWAFNFNPVIAGDGAARRQYRLAAMLVHDTAPPVVADPETRYTFAADEVTDTWTGLTWRRCSGGQTWDGATCAGDVLKGDWRAALRYAADESARTGQDWRLPNVKELSSIADRTRNYPAIDPDVFPNTPVLGFYWTSTPLGGDPSQVITIDNRGGYSQPFPSTEQNVTLRLVRDTP